MTLLKQHPMAFSNLLDEFLNHNATTIYSPAVNIFENEHSFIMEFNVPGINKEAVSIQVEKGLLTVHYDHKINATPTTQKTIRKEFQQKGFKRVFSLDEKINADHIEANYENGILTLLLPKMENTISPKKIIAVK